MSPLLPEKSFFKINALKISENAKGKYQRAILFLEKAKAAI